MMSCMAELQCDALPISVSSSPEYPNFFNSFPSFEEPDSRAVMGIDDTPPNTKFGTGPYPLAPVSTVSCRSDVPKDVTSFTPFSTSALKVTGHRDMVIGNKAKTPKRKKSRTTFTETQISRLEERYRCHRYLPTDERVELAEELHMTNQQVTKWFQNRRMKQKRQESNARDAITCQSSGDSVREALPAPGALATPVQQSCMDSGHLFPFIDGPARPVPISSPLDPRRPPKMLSASISTHPFSPSQNNLFAKEMSLPTSCSSPFSQGDLRYPNLPQFLHPYHSQCSYHGNFPNVDFPSIQTSGFQTPQLDQLQLSPLYFS